MLLGNYSVINKSPAKFFAGTSSSNVRSNFSKNGSLRGIYSNETIPDQWGLPVGYSSGWMLPRKAGYMVSFSESNLTQSGNAVMGVNGDGNILIELTATADLSLVVSATGICDILLTVTGDAVGALYANGTSNIELTATGTLGAVAFSTGESVITLSASADISALGHMTGEMTPFTELSPEGLASAVWNTIASEYNTTGTMGAKLNLASSGGVDMNALAQVVWEYGVRSLTESAGLSTEEHDKLMSLSGGGGGVSINYGAINSHTTKKVEELKEQIAQIPKTDISGIETKLNDIDSHIELAFDSTIDTIKETENYICKDIKKTKSELKEDNVATRQLVRQKTKNLAELAQKQLDSDAKEDKMMKDIQKEFEELENEDNELEKEFENQEMEDIKKEFENQEKETKQP